MLSASRGTTTGLAAVLCAVGWLVVAPVSSGWAQTPSSSHRALLDRYCVTCHNERLRTAGLTLDTVDLADVAAEAEVWEMVVRKLRADAMPPGGRPRPDRGASAALVTWLETALDRAAAERPDPGRRPAIHRLNRTEYANAVGALLGLEVDARELLPADDTDVHGFDNIADVLSTSPALLERYMSAARKVSRLAIGLAPAGPSLRTYDVPQELFQVARMSEDLPFGSRGGFAIRHHFPVDGEYVIRVRLQRSLYGHVRGIATRHELDLRLAGALLQRFSVGGVDAGDPPPSGFGGTIDASPEWEKYASEADAGLEVRVPVTAGTHVVGVSFVPQVWAAEDVRQPRHTGFGADTSAMLDSDPAVESVEIGGPYGVDGPGETPSRERVFVCRPTGPSDETRCATTILSTLVRRAYRRPVTGADIETLLGFYNARPGASFDARIQLGLQMILADPEFLFRVEYDPPDLADGTAYRISDLDLASRLSFFLWSSIPDDELLDVAIRGELADPTVLRQQVRRMLADARSRALVENFAGQWLVLRNIRDVEPDSDLLPEFDENLREAFQRETELFVESQLRDDRSVVDLLNADYTFLNERLARHYGIPNVYGSHLRRVRVDEAQRGGLLGHGSLLTVTSYPNRTSPVLRGKWLLENILGSPPPEPPPDVPALEERGSDGQPQSVRARLEAHRENPVCAACHAPMDPLGFALENFDAVGMWRSTDAGAPIDASGTLPGGREFQGFAGLRELLVTEYRDQFVSTVIERLLTYALGRGLQYYDAPAVRQIRQAAASSDHRWSSIILGIVESTPFQMRRAES